MDFSRQKRLCLFPSPYSKGLSLASQKIILDMVRFSSEISFKPILLGRRNRVLEFAKYYFRAIKSWREADVILTIYPYICINLRRNYFLRKIESMLINHLSRNMHSILYVVDLPIERSMIEHKLSDEEYKRACEIEERVFRSFRVLLVFNENMKRKIQEKYGFDDDKFLLFEVLDYSAEISPRGFFQFYKPLRIAFLASVLDRRMFSWIKEIPLSKDMIYSFFGIDGEWINNLGREDIKYEGFIPPEKIPSFLDKYHFGMINYESSIEKYLQYGSTSKFSAYIAAGLPVLCSSKLSYLSSLISKYDIGFSFDSLDDIPDLLLKMDKKLYITIKENCVKLGEKVRQGYFLKRAISLALQKMGITTR